MSALDARWLKVWPAAVRRAWDDPGFHDYLVRDPRAAIQKAFNFKIPAEVDFRVIGDAGEREPIDISDLHQPVWDPGRKKWKFLDENAQPSISVALVIPQDPRLQAPKGRGGMVESPSPKIEQVALKKYQETGKTNGFTCCC